MNAIDPVQALEASLSSEDRELLDKLADGVVRRGMTPVAVFFLESMKPLGYVGAQLMVFLRPVIQSIWSNPATYDRLAGILERRGSLELLLRRIEAKQ